MTQMERDPWKVTGPCQYGTFLDELAEKYTSQYDRLEDETDTDDEDETDNQTMAQIAYDWLMRIRCIMGDIDSYEEN